MASRNNNYVLNSNNNNKVPPSSSPSEAADSSPPPPVAAMEYQEVSRNEAIEGVLEELFEKNERALNQIKRNLDSDHLLENLELINQTREDVNKILNELSGLMRKLPSLSVMLDEIDPKKDN